MCRYLAGEPSYDEAAFYFLDMSAEQELAHVFRLRAMPFLLAFRDGKEVTSISMNLYFLKSAKREIRKLLGRKEHHPERKDDID